MSYNLLCELIKITDDMCALLDIQDYYNAMKFNCNLAKTLQKLVAQESGLDAGVRAEFAQAACEFMDAQENEDYIRMSDVCRMKFRALCAGVISDMRCKGIWQDLKDFYDINYAACNADMRKMLDSINAGDDSDIPDTYQLEETQVGSFALKIMRGKTGTGSGKTGYETGFSLDGTGNPYIQAKAFIDAHCTGEAAQCVLLGLGMGYNAIALDARQDIVQTEIYEHDAFVIKAALHYSDLSAILANGKVSIYYDPQLKSFSERLSRLNKADVLIHYPSLQNIQNKQLRDRVEDFFLHYSSVRSQEKQLRGNFIMNTTDVPEDTPSNISADKSLNTSAYTRSIQTADSLIPEFQGKNVLFIAGGPSLDDNIAWLADMYTEYTVTSYCAENVTSRSLNETCGGEEYIVVCVGTVLKRLISEGIIPDYVIMTDAQPNMQAQISGIDASKLSLIYLSTLYYKVPRMWNGRRYIALQSGFEPAERIHKVNGGLLFNTGGSVSTFALDFFFQLKCAKVVCMGLDLAYTDGMRHAGDLVSGNFGDCRMVAAVGGGTVSTAKNLDNYRMWIEQRLKMRNNEEKGVKCINVSRGAVIHGMENVLPKDWN